MQLPGGTSHRDYYLFTKEHTCFALSESELCSLRVQEHGRCPECTCREYFALMLYPNCEVCRSQLSLLDAHTSTVDSTSQGGERHLAGPRGHGHLGTQPRACSRTVRSGLPDSNLS